MIAVIVTAPRSTVVEESRGWVSCCSMSSTFSTSRTSVVWTTEELTLLW